MSLDPAGRPKLQRRAVAAVVLGNALEFYDFTIYAFFAKAIGETFFPAKDATASLLASLALFGIGYAMRPIGGVLIGAFADRAGRKPAMLITIALMAIGMVMLAAAPGYATLGSWAQAIVIAGRLIQGLALGGEVGPSTAYLLEAAEPSRRGFVASWQIASQGCAALFAGLIASALAYAVGDQAMGAWGWRVMFGLGIAVVPIGLVIRSHLPENGGHRAGLRGRGLDPRGGPAAPARPRQTAPADLPGHRRLDGVEFGRHQHAGLCGLDPRDDRDRVDRGADRARPRLGAASAARRLVRRPRGATAGDDLAAGADRALRRAGVSVAGQGAGAGAVYAVTFLLSALSSINAAAIIVAIPESLPRAVRSAGLSIVYALAVTIFGGSTNYVVNKLIAVTGDKLIPAYYLVAFSIVGTIAAALMPETRGRDLDEDR